MSRHILFHQETGGQAMTEFAIVFPVLFLLFLVIIQAALLMTARQVVEYAAFSAARSAIVYRDNDEKAKRAADIACLSISPKLDADGIQAFKDYVNSLGTLVFDASEMIDDYPELLGFSYTWDEVPGMEIIDKLREVNLSDLMAAENLNLVAGLEFIDLQCGGHQEVPLRYPAATLLTDMTLAQKEGDVTVEIVHNYAMRIPIVNKLFFMAHLYGKVRDEIRRRYSNLPATVLDQIDDRALDAIRNLADASPGHALYLLPIKGTSVLRMEIEAGGEKYCN